MTVAPWSDHHKKHTTKGRFSDGWPRKCWDQKLGSMGYFHLHPGKLTWQWKHHHLKMYLLSVSWGYNPLILTFYQNFQRPGYPRWVHDFVDFFLWDEIPTQPCRASQTGSVLWNNGATIGCLISVAPKWFSRFYQIKSLFFLGGFFGSQFWDGSGTVKHTKN